jgi:AmmeMemoRadiSam system protein B
MSIREAKNCGSFYPCSTKELDGLIDIFNSALDSAKEVKHKLKIEPKAIISPHAGYIYSGFSANFAHRILANNKVKRVVVIGPSHHTYFEGISGSFFHQYQTPYKNLDIDVSYLNVMHKEFKLKFVESAHSVEHSTETQMPFIAKYQPDVKVIELIYGKTDYKEVAKIIKWLLQDSLTSVIISTDLSHFYTQEKASMLDGICIEGIKKLDNQILDIGCEACGIIGIKALIEAANSLNLKSEILDYRTSAEVTKDTNRVVGYMAAAVY